ncbi:MAG: 30S ribosomal protein S6--L-glutamate ligase [Deltaproteobacteria bacterium]|nr:30S ribosomal protein S6--L-glutamate ligase [Deltaproteobacteria bacterium]
MKVAILSRSPNSYSTRALIEAGLRHGHQVKVLDTLNFSISVEPGRPGLFYQSKQFSTYDGIIPRIGASITFYGTAVVRQFEQMGVYTLNTSQSIMTSRDKLRSMQILSRHRIGLPATAFVRNKQDVLPAIERVGGAPVIIKLLEGTQGIGVILADTESVAAAIIETLQSTKQNVLIQKFVAESKGRDVRAFVVGDRVVAAMRRRAQGQEFRSNVHRGGTTEKVTLDPVFERTAVRATQILGLHVAGVDMLEGEEGPQIMEVNSSPGLEGIQTATGIDIAGHILEYMEQQVLFPEIDLRQRLTLEAGYGVAEFQVSGKSALAGKTISNCGLREEDVLVLSIDHDHSVIPNPKGSRMISAGDKLLCFGKLSALKDRIPAKKNGGRRIRK